MKNDSAANPNEALQSLEVWIEQKKASRKAAPVLTPTVGPAPAAPVEKLTTNPSATKKIRPARGAKGATFSNLSSRGKKVTYVLIGAAIALIVAIALILTFEFVTPDQGITTNLGNGKGHTVLITKMGPFAANDLVVAVLPGSGSGDNKKLIIGTVFSSNDQTSALYDGQVMWQIPLGDIIGKVLFTQALESVN